MLSLNHGTRSIFEPKDRILYWVEMISSIVQIQCMEQDSYIQELYNKQILLASGLSRVARLVGSVAIHVLK